MQGYISQKHLHQKPTPRLTEMGFTLVEGLVAGVVSMVVVGIMIAILMMSGNGTKDGAVNAKVQSQYEIAIAEIGNNARSASFVLNDAAGEKPPASVADVFTSTTTSKIIMYYRNANGDTIRTRGFWVDNGMLKEWRPGWTGYQPFIVGNWTAISVPDATPFQLAPSRKTLTVFMSVNGTFSGITAVVPARGEVFICRN